MGILDRLTTLVRANLNSTLAPSADPETAYDRTVSEMRAALDEGRRHVAELTAQQKALTEDLKRCQRLALDWGAKARLAVSNGQESLAREALRRQADYESAAALYGQQIEAQQGMIDELSADVVVLQTRYEAALSQRETAIAQQRVAQAQRKLRQALRAHDPLDSQQELAQLEERIHQDESIPLPAPTVSAAGQPEKDAEIERRLEAIKRDLSSKV